MRSLRLLSVDWNAGLRRALLLLLPGVILAISTVHCGGSDENPQQPEVETGGETEIDSADETAPVDAPGETTADTAPADTGVTVTCSKGPSYGAPLRVNHNPDSLRRVANAGMVRLEDGRLMIVMLEAIDTTSRHAVWARTVDPTTSTISPDERLDVDADGMTDASALQVFAIPGNAVGVRYSGSHLRVYSKGKWSPDLASAMSIAATDEIGAVAATSGQVLVTRGRAGTAPNANAITFRPDEGGAKGSWSVVQTLDLDGSTGKPRIDAHALSDGRFVTLTWHGAGGPAVRIRSLSGSWSTPSPKAEVGAVDANPQYRLLDDGSIVLAGLEGVGDTRRVVTSTWTVTDNWSTARLLSKLPGDTNGVVPASVGPYLFTVTGAETEFVAWIAGCATVAKDCEFQAVSRRYSGGTWKEPVALGVGEKRNGADGVSVVALDGATPLVGRTSFAKTNVDLRVRNGADYTATMALTAESPLFGAGTSIEARFYGTATDLWTLVSRTRDVMGVPTPTSMVMGRVSAASGKVSWSVITAGSYEIRSFADVYPYVDGAGGFSVGATATTGTENAPVLAHANAPATDVTVEASSVISTDEKSVAFVNVPRFAPRPGRDRSAIYLLRARPTDTTSRLRAYAFNGIGSGVPRVLANESRAPREFADGTINFGCGGAILYAADPIDGSHTLELVIVREAAAVPDAG
jgi:hypothetical protein